MNTNANPNPITTLLVIMTMAIALFATTAKAQRVLEKDEIRELNGVNLIERQGATAPMDAIFTTADGKDVALAQYFLDDKPTVLALVYYDCPIVCPTVLRALGNTINELDYSTGEDYRILVISFDHKETTTHALTKREDFIRTYERTKNDPSVREGIEFFTGSKESIKALAASVGFEFNELQDGEYAHPISLMALSPKGKLTRYLYGYNYPAEQLKLTLLDASKGTIAKSWGDKIKHFCYRYNPVEGTYSLVAFRVMQIGALSGLAVLVTCLIILFMGDKARKRRQETKNKSNPDAAASNSSSINQSSTAAGKIAGVPPGQMS